MAGAFPFLNGLYAWCSRRCCCTIIGHEEWTTYLSPGLQLLNTSCSNLAVTGNNDSFTIFRLSRLDSICGNEHLQEQVKQNRQLYPRVKIQRLRMWWIARCAPTTACEDDPRGCSGFHDRKLNRDRCSGLRDVSIVPGLSSMWGAFFCPGLTGCLLLRFLSSNTPPT